jgi:hypothetical protein
MKGSTEELSEQRRLAFAAQVLHRSQQKGESLRESYRRLDASPDRIGNPFPSLKAFERFLERRRGNVGEVALKFAELSTRSDIRNPFYEGEPTEGVPDAPLATPNDRSEAQLEAALERQDRQLTDEQRDFVCRTLQTIRKDKAGRVVTDLVAGAIRNDKTDTLYRQIVNVIARHIA